MIDSLRNKKHESYDRLTKRIRGEISSVESRRRAKKDRLMDDMKRAIKRLIKHPCAVEETLDLVNETLDAHKGRLLKAKRYGLVGACIYYLGAKHQLGISLSDICKEFGLKMRVISVCLKQVKELCPDFEYERPNIRDLVKNFVDRMATRCYDHSASEYSTTSVRHTDPRELKSIPLIDLKDKSVLRDRVMLLLDLFEAMHPYNQPTPQSMISAVIYHAWRSLDTFKLIAFNLRCNLGKQLRTSDPSKKFNPTEFFTPNHDELAKESCENTQLIARHSVSYEKFCQLCDLKYSSNGHKIVSKLQTSLLMLGRHLGNVNKMNLPWFLEDIIENSLHLIKEHKRYENKSQDNPPQ